MAILSSGPSSGGIQNGDRMAIFVSGGTQNGDRMAIVVSGGTQNGHRMVIFASGGIPDLVPAECKMAIEW